jgi:hypothetical protein
MTKAAYLIAAGLLGLACSSSKLTSALHADASDAPLSGDAPLMSEDGPSDAPPDGLPPGLVAPAPPDVACTGDADAAAACDLPPSTCAMWPGACDAGALTCIIGSAWIVYYENPRCVAGHCVWDQAYFECAGGKACRAGACTTILTTA